MKKLCVPTHLNPHSLSPVFPSSAVIPFTSSRVNLIRRPPYSCGIRFNSTIGDVEKHQETTLQKSELHRQTNNTWGEITEAYFNKSKFLQFKSAPVVQSDSRPFLSANAKVPTERNRTWNLFMSDGSSGAPVLWLTKVLCTLTSSLVSLASFTLVGL